VLAANTYANGPAVEIQVAAHGSSSRRLALGDSFNWYDYSLRVQEMPGWLRRFAGHLENGEDSVSDPAMHGPAELDQYRI